jgi:HEAT repeat protein
VVKHAKPKFSPTLAVGLVSFLLPLFLIENSWAQWLQENTQAETGILMNKFKHRNPQYHSFDSSDYDSKAVSILTNKALKNEQMEVRHPAAYTLERTGEKAEKWHLPSWIALALGSLGSEAEGIIFALIQALTDEEAEVRSRAAYVLGSICGEAKEDAVPVLIEALTDNEWQVRLGAVYALGSIGSEAKITMAAIVPALIKLLKDREGSVRRLAASALEGIGVKAKEAVPALIETLKDKDDNVRIHAALALGSIGAQTQEAIPALIETLKDKSRHVRSFTADALVQIGEDLQSKKDMLSIPQLHTILEALAENEAEFGEQIQCIGRSLEALKSSS